jgi:hypothetical protein
MANVDVPKAETINQKAMNSICHLRIVDQIHRRLKDGNGDVLVDAPNGCSEEGEDPLRGVLLLRAVTKDEAPGNKRHRVNRVIHHGCEHRGMLLDGGRGRRSSGMKIKWCLGGGRLGYKGKFQILLP